MIIGKKDLTDYFRKVSKKYFAIYYRNKVETGNPIFKSNEAEEIDMESVLLEFQEFLNFLRAGDYTLIVNDGVKVSNRGNNRVDFRITLEESNQAGAPGQLPAAVGSTGQPVMSVDEMRETAKQMAMEQFERLMEKRDLEEHKRKLAESEAARLEAEKKVNDPINKFIAALSPHAEPIIAGIFSKAGITGPAAVGAVEDSSAAVNQSQAIFENFAGALDKARPTDSLAVLQKLTDLINKDPEKFNQALNYL